MSTRDGSRAGRLVVVSTPIGNLGDLAPRVVETLADADVIAAEDTRRTRALLTHAGVTGGSRLRSVRADNEEQACGALVDEIFAGATVAYVTDAGTPTVSDPGARLVRACHDSGLVVSSVPGPSAVTSALSVSGMDADRFVFEGFLPRKGQSRRERLEALASETRTAVLYESPRRVVATLDDLAAICAPERIVVIARELTKLHEEVRRVPISEATNAVGGEPRGEFVLVLEGGLPSEVSDDDILAALDEALARGLSVRDAATDVATRLGIGRRRVYEFATRRST